MPLLKVGIFGHSYIRDLARYSEQFNLNNIEVGSDTLSLRFFSHPGSTFKTFLDHPELLEDVLEFNPRILVVYLGGNDLKTDVELKKVKDNCKNLFVYLRQALPCTYIIGSQIEPRYLSVENRHGTPAAEKFSVLANYFNCWINRQAFKDRLLCIKGPNKLSNPSLFRRDFIHLNNQGLAKLFDILKSILVDTYFYRLQ